jgi:hypothetical protein
VSEILSFFGQVRYASEHTIYRVSFARDTFTFIRTGRSEPLAHVGGVKGLVTAAISASVHKALDSGPASESGERVDELALRQLLAEDKRNFQVPVRDVSNPQIKLPLFAALGWVKPQFVFWKLHVRDRGHITVWIGGENIKVAVPLLLGLFGDIVAGKWTWDQDAWQFRKRTAVPAAVK